MFCLGVVVIFAFLPSGRLSAAISRIPNPEDARIGDVETLCDWFCSDYDAFDYYDVFRSEKRSARIFCHVCEKKGVTTTTTTSTAAPDTVTTTTISPASGTLPPQTQTPPQDQTQTPEQGQTPPPVQTQPPTQNQPQTPPVTEP